MALNRQPNGEEKRLNFSPKVYDPVSKTYRPIYIPPDATDLIQGDVVLSDAVDGTEDAATGMTAATPKAVKTVNDNLNDKVSKSDVNPQTIKSSLFVEGKVTATNENPGFVGNVQGDVTGNAGSATKLKNGRTISVKAGANASAAGSATFNGESDITITIPAINFDDMTVDGKLGIKNLPQGALERLVKVQNQAARFRLTPEIVQLGDTVLQLDTGIMYIVTSEERLDSESGYQEYKAGTALKAMEAEAAEKLGSATIGSETQPIYLDGGEPKVIGVEIPLDAKFTDTTYEVFAAASTEEDGTEGLVPAPEKGEKRYLTSLGTWEDVTSGVSGIKGDYEEEYRQGDVNLTYADIPAVGVEYDYEIIPGEREEPLPADEGYEDQHMLTLDNLPVIAESLTDLKYSNTLNNYYADELPSQFIFKVRRVTDSISDESKSMTTDRFGITIDGEPYTDYSIEYEYSEDSVDSSEGEIYYGVHDTLTLTVNSWPEISQSKVVSVVVGLGQSTEDVPDIGYLLEDVEWSFTFNALPIPESSKSASCAMKVPNKTDDSPVLLDETIYSLGKDLGTEEHPYENVYGKTFHGTADGLNKTVQLDGDVTSEPVDLSQVEDGNVIIQTTLKGGDIEFWKSERTPGEFYKADEAPVSTDVGKFDGYLYATRVYNAVWNDYAELFEASEKVEVGHVAYATDDGRVKSTGKAKQAVGIVSDCYGYLVGGNGNPDDENFVAIGLAGRVPVEVEEPQKVEIGDYLIASDNGLAVASDSISPGFLGKCVGPDPAGRENYKMCLLHSL